MKGLSVRFAKGLNRMMGRSGRVIADRFHSRVLATPSEVRRAMDYIRNNARKHAAQRGDHYTASYVDPFSSGPFAHHFRPRPPGSCARVAARGGAVSPPPRRGPATRCIVSDLPRLSLDLIGCAEYAPGATRRPRRRPGRCPAGPRLEERRSAAGERPGYPRW